MNCLICNEKANFIFKGMVLGKYEIQYYQCPHCGLLFTEKPYWIEEAYKDAIVGTDTGIMQRNYSFSVITNTIIARLFNSKNLFVDYGAGYGIFVRMMRDLGYNFRWADKYSDNILAKGFEYKFGEADLVTAFELFEHFDNPIGEIEHLLTISHNILISTTLYSKEFDYPQLNDWWYYAPHAGQHITFYSYRTFEFIAKKYNLHYYQLTNNVHLFSEKEISGLNKFLCSNNLFAKIYQLFLWLSNRRNALCEKDMEIVLKGNDSGC